MSSAASLPPFFSPSAFSRALYWPNPTGSHLVRESTKVTGGKLWSRVQKDGEWIWGFIEHIHRAQ